MWNIYDHTGNWLGTAQGSTEEEAVKNAKDEGLSTADYADLRTDPRAC